MSRRLSELKTLTNIFEVVGDTPLVRLNRIGGSERERVLVKLESLNPGGSIKDRVGMELIRAAEREGRLSPGGTVVEATAGNTGIALAMAAAVLGYRSIFVVPDKMSADKIAIMRAYGAEVRIVQDAPREDPDNYQEVAKQIARDTRGAAYMGQFENVANPQVHYDTTGPEIWSATDGQVAAVVAGIGTGGTISGIGRFLKEKNPRIQVIAADPVGSIFTGPVAPFAIEGMGEDYYPDTLDSSVVDRFVAVNDDDAFHMSREMARQEGILVGGSSGAILTVALREASRVEEDGYVVALMPDTGRNYLANIFRESSS